MIQAGVKTRAIASILCSCLLGASTRSAFAAPSAAGHVFTAQELQADIRRILQALPLRVNAGTAGETRQTELRRNIQRMWTFVDDRTVGQSMQQRLQTDAMILATAYEQSPLRTGTLLQGDALLYVTADAWSHMLGPIEAATQLHDFAQSWSTTAQNEANTELNLIISLIASLGDEANFAAYPAMANGQYYGRAVQAMHKGHHWLRQAMQPYLEAQALAAGQSETAVTEDVPAIAPLAALIERCAVRKAQFEQTGYFDGLPKPELVTGLGEGQGDALLAGLQQRIALLDGRLGHFDTEQRAYLQHLRSGVNFKTSRLRENLEMRQISDEINRLRTQLAATRLADAESELRHGNFVADLARLKASGALADSGFFLAGSREIVRISGMQAPATWPAELSDAAVQRGDAVFAMQLQAGQWAHFSVSGQYAPTCALQATQHIGSIQIDQAQVREATVGSEGFYLQKNAHGFTAERYDTQKERSRTVTNTEGIRVGASASGGWSKLIGINASVSVYHETSVATANAERKSHGNSSGSDQSTSASFSNGIRLPNTPFPQYPAGALLFVQVDDAQQLVSAEVVRAPQTSVLVQQNATGYLVVNDLRTDCLADDSHALTVEFDLLQPPAEVLAQLQRAMDETLQALADWSAAYVQVPDMTAAHTQLKSAALARLSASRAHGTQGVPEPLMALFSAWIDKTLAQLDLRQTGKRLERALDAALLQERVQYAQLQLSQTDAGLLGLQLRWARSCSSDSLLAWHSQEVLLYVQQQMAGALALQWPEVRQKLATDQKFQQTVRSLKQLSWSQAHYSAALDAAHGRSALAHTLLETLSMLATTAQDAQATRDSTVNRRLTVVRVNLPRPSATDSTDDQLTQAAFWHGLQTGGESILQLRPTHLYGPSSEALTIHQETPVIRAMGIHFVLPATAQLRSLNDAQHRMSIQIDPVMPFLTAAGLQSYRMTNARWLTPSNNQMLFGIDSRAKATFEERAAGLATARGLSPLATFRIDFSRLAPQLLALLQDEALSVDVLFELETQPCATHSCMSWAETSSY